MRHKQQFFKVVKLENSKTRVSAINVNFVKLLNLLFSIYHYSNIQHERQYRKVVKLLYLGLDNPPP